MGKLLNVGGNSKTIHLPSQYAGFDHVLLDIDPSGNPDIVCDARQLKTLQAGQFDAIYCSHNLEHYHYHEVAEVLAGFLHVLKPGGIAHVKVPDIAEVMRATVEKGLDLDDVLYNSPAGPIKVLDVIYGYSLEIQHSGQDFYAHKTGFTPALLIKALAQSGFTQVFSANEKQPFEINMLASKGPTDPVLRHLFGLP